MRHLFIITILLLCFSSCKNGTKDYVTRITEHRKSIDEIFYDEKTSPLSDADRKIFSGLPYFPIDRNFQIKARIEKFDSMELVEINHTLNRKYPFIRWGKAHFKIYNDSCHLTIYLSADKDTTTYKMLFIPFKDETNKDETYAGGRYLDVEMSEMTSIDFNLAYNPNCAYSDNWSCPIVPEENILHTFIRAGAKAFPKSH